MGEFLALLITEAGLGTPRVVGSGGIPDEIRAVYLACYDGDRYVESMRYVRTYPEELPALAELLPQITTPVTIINGTTREEHTMSSTTTQNVPRQASRAATTYVEAPNQSIRAGNGVDYLYRDVGVDSRPLVLLQHFRGNLDNWDPALMDLLAQSHRVVAFDNVGVGGSSGTTPGSVEQMAVDALAFLDALDLDTLDLVGFSLGSFVAQEIALVRPSLVNSLVLASSAPRGAAGMHGWAPAVIGAVGARETSPAGVLGVFYAESAASRAAGVESFGRMGERSADRDTPTTWQTRVAQYDAVCSWGVPDHSALQRVKGIEAPTFVANGDSDPMILPRYSHLLAGLLPDAQLTIYPDAAHGFLFQHHQRFAADVSTFVNGART